MDLSVLVWLFRDLGRSTIIGKVVYAVKCTRVVVKTSRTTEHY